MRLLVLAVIALMLSGCLQQPEPAPPGNATTPQPQPAPPPANATPPAQNQTSGNISQAPLPQPIPANITPNQTGNQSQGNQNGSATNQTFNQTTNYTSASNAPEGLPFPDSNYSLFLDDVSLVPTSSEPCGIFSIRDRNQSILDKMLICPPESADWTSPEGHLYRIRVDEVAAGYTMQTNWAKVEIFG